MINTKNLLKMIAFCFCATCLGMSAAYSQTASTDTTTAINNRMNDILGQAQGSGFTVRVVPEDQVYGGVPGRTNGGTGTTGTETDGNDVRTTTTYNHNSGGVNDNVQTTVTTTRNGEQTTQTSEGYATGGSNSGSGSSGSPLVVTPVSVNEPAAAAQNASRDAATNPNSDSAQATSADDATAATDANYTGVYNGHQVLPDMMMIYCQMNAEDIIKDLSKLEECLKKYVSAINNSNASAKSEAIHDFNALRYKTLVDVASTAITKLASVANFEEAMNKQGEATAEMKTEFDTEAALINTQAFSTEVMNSIRELYADILKYQAIDGMVNIDPDAIIDEDEEEEEDAGTTKSASTGVNATQITATTQITPEETAGGDGDEGGDAETDTTGADTNRTVYNGDNYCIVNGGTPGPCPDGEFKDANGTSFKCVDGECGAVGSGSTSEEHEIGEVIVTGLNWKKWEDMTPEEFAQHQDEWNEIRQRMLNQMNAADASDSNISAAQHNLEKMSDIEDQKANWGGEDDFTRVSDEELNAAANEEPASNVDQSQHDADLERARNMTQEQREKAVASYKKMMENNMYNEQQQALAQYYISVLCEAMPRSLKKRESICD